MPNLTEQLSTFRVTWSTIGGTSFLRTSQHIENLTFLKALACETRVSEDPLLRRPGNVVWIIAQGRLKRAHTSQLRHSSERERLIAEAASAPTLPWTFTALGQTLDKGQYEDLIQDRPLPGVRGPPAQAGANTLRSSRSTSRTSCTGCSINIERTLTTS